MAFNLINFKKGTLAGLEALKTANSGAGAIEEGTFYLTIDDQKQTSRLFIGTSATTALPVNSNISIVTNTSDLEATGAATPFNDGDFAYVSNGNILAVKIGNAWHQINAPDSRAVKSLTPEIATTNGVATISWKLRDQSGNVIPEASASNPDNVVENSTPDITIQGANGITASSSGDALTLTGTSYQMGSAAVVAESDTAIIKLQSKDSASATPVDVSSITITGGTNVNITGDNANAFTISAEDSTIRDVSVTNNAQAGFDIFVQDTSLASDTATLDPKITLGTHTATADEIHFTNGVANLPVYTKDEIDAMNRALDAVVYRGTVGTGGSIATDVGSATSNPKTGIPLAETNGIQIGYAYKLLGDSTDTYSVVTGYNGNNPVTTTAHGGDIIIANGTESNGVITDATLFYDIIPSGDVVTEYKGLGVGNTGNGIQVEDGNNTVLASIEIAAGNQVAVSSTHEGTHGEKATVTVAHGLISNSTNGDANTPSGNAAAANTQDAHSSKEFDVVTGLTTNNGHVTGTTVTRIRVVDTVSQLDTTNTAVAVTAPASGETDYEKAATVTNSIYLKDENNTAINHQDLAFTLRSDNLKVTTSGNAITANLVWGTF